jgi:para-nitrobenzyl esterase
MAWAAACDTRIRVSQAYSPAAPNPSNCLKVKEWDPPIDFMYAAIRDAKAAVRWMRANAATYGIAPDSITVSGGSAGAVTAQALGIILEDDYKTELTGIDTTLATTNIQQSSAVQAVVSHWGAAYGVDAKTQLDGIPRYRKGNAPMIAYVGSLDNVVPLCHDTALQAHYVALGIAFELHVLPGEKHGCWHATVPYRGRNLSLDEQSFTFLTETLGYQVLP